MLNIIATYGRSLYALVIGLFCGRWTLMALGEVDYGLMGVVGGLAAFISFLNGIMAGGVGRFYAISVGESQKDPVRGLEKCREWFTTAVVIHTILPIALMIIGYPIGEWAVRRFLTIPPDRIESCVWVWRFTCISCFVGMASVPYHAMYGAKQEIAELTIYSFVTTTFNVIFLYYAIKHPGDWLSRLALWGCFLSVTPSLIITIRSLLKYPECRFRRAYMKCWGRVREMLTYSGWIFIGTLADILSGQGVSVLINKFFGPRFNAAQNVGNTMSGHCQTLSGSLIGAFWPVITTAYGAGEIEKVRVYAYRVSRMATVLILIFAVPLALEVDEVLRLWLKNPPIYASGLCLCGLIYAVIDKTSFGYAIAAHATGRMAMYQLGVGGIFLLTLPIALVVAHFGGGIYAVAATVVIMRFGVVVGRVVLSRRVVAVSVRYWISRIIVPIFVIVAVAVVIGILPKLYFRPSFGRICLTTFCVEGTMLPFAWIFLLDADERKFLVEKIKITIGSFV